MKTLPLTLSAASFAEKKAAVEFAALSEGVRLGTWSGFSREHSEFAQLSLYDNDVAVGWAAIFKNGEWFVDAYGKRVAGSEGQF